MTTDAVIPVEKCRPHERNYNAHSEAQIKDLAESLRQFGQVRSIVVQAQKGKTFLLVAGHGIWLAAKKAGLKELRANVIPASWSKTKVLAYLAADNELSRRGSPDEEQLAAIVRDVCEAEGEAMAALAAGERAALDKILAIEAGEADAEPQVDRAAELQEKWQTALGQLWQIGPHRLLCGDSTRREDVERVMGGERADCMLTDPPYNVDYKGNYIQSGKILNDDKKIWEGNSFEDKIKDFDKWLNGAYGVFNEFMNNGCAIYIWHPSGAECRHFWSAWLWDVWHFQVDLVWNKQSLIIARWDYKPQHEPCMYGWKGANRKWNGPNNEPTVWDYPRQQGNSGGKREHPTEKPLPIFERCLKNHEANVVFEPFAGSGTTLVACQNLGRVCRAIELSPAYCAVILERMVTAFPTLDVHKVD